jgi:hypothetical protein
VHANRLEAAESRADKAAADAATQAAQLQHLFGRYKAFKSAEVADLDARLRAAMSGSGGSGSANCDTALAAGGKENDKAAAALLRLAAPHSPPYIHTYLVCCPAAYQIEALQQLLG